MSDKEIKNIFRAVKAVKMTAKEKALLREVLLAKILPAPGVKAKVAATPIPVSAVFAQTMQNILRKPIPVAIPILILAFVFGGGLMASAEYALPGDVLYPIKVGVNESLKSAFSFSTEAKAAWDAERVERRLTETELLAASSNDGELSESVQAQLAQNFEVFAESAKSKVTKLEAEGKTEAALELATRLDASLRAHGKILAQLDAQTTAGLSGFIAKVEAQGNSAAETRSKAEVGVTGSSQDKVKAAAEKRKAAAEEKISEAAKTLTKVKNRLGMEAAARTQARLESARRLMAEGEASLSLNEYDSAFTKFGQAKSKAQEAKSLLETQSQLKLRAPLLNLEIELEAEEEEERQEVSPVPSPSAAAATPTTVFSPTPEVEPEDDEETELKEEIKSSSTSGNEQQGFDFKIDIRDVLNFGF